MTEVNNDTIDTSSGREEIETAQSVPTDKTPKRKRKLTSNVWKDFEILPLGTDLKQRAKCKKCGQEYLADSSYGTGNMKRHVLACKRRDTRDIGQLLLSQSTGTLSVYSSKFDPEKFRELLTIAIIKHDLPFQFVEYEGIRNLFNYISKDINIISRNTAKADVLKMHRIEKERLNFLMQSIPGRICLTSDLWTSIATDGYLSLTAHFVDHEWVLQKRILNFSLMPPPHTGVALAEKVQKLLNEWGIEKKIFAITLDNASANDLFVELLKEQLMLKDALISRGEFFHIRCCAHILNLIVQDGLKEIHDAVCKIRESIKYVKGSLSRKQKFLECVAQVSIESKKGLRQDVPTRWNATYLMLESAIFYRRAFWHLQLSDSNYKHCPSSEEWGKVEKIAKFLKVFYDATCCFSRSKYPTANLYFSEVWLIQLTLKEEMLSYDGFMRKMAEQMQKKFDKYWSEFSIILAISVILDPRYKFQFVEFYYKKLYGSGSSESILVRQKLFSLFDEYMCNNSGSSSSASIDKNIAATNASRERNDKASQALLEEFDTFESEEFGYSVQKSQLELYLDEPRVERTMELDVLQFWKANQFRYPELSLMARDVLSIPISTVASESAFSIGGRVLDQYRSSLKPENAEALICTQDWLFGSKDNFEPKLDDLTEDVMNSDSQKDALSSIGCSNYSNIMNN